MAPNLMKYVLSPVKLNFTHIMYLHIKYS